LDIIVLFRHKKTSYNAGFRTFFDDVMVAAPGIEPGTSGL